MLRKLSLVAVAAASLGAAALAPTSASAHWHGGWHGGGWHHGRHGHGGRFAVGAGYGYPYYNSYAYSEGDCYLVRRRVLTRVGWRVRRVQVCD